MKTHNKKKKATYTRIVRWLVGIGLETIQVDVLRAGLCDYQITWTDTSGLDHSIPLWIEPSYTEILELLSDYYAIQSDWTGFNPPVF